MIHKYQLNNPILSLKSDLAAQFPIYIYLSVDKKYLLYSTSIEEILNHKEVIRPLALRDESISFLLQSGIVPLPHTIYQNLFIIGIGDEANISTVSNRIKIQFSHQFPFKNKNRDTHSEVNETYILELLAKATTSNLNLNNNSYLFHSAGKDSNMIALAMAEAGYQDKITCLTHKSKGSHDESEISQKIAKQLGFKHQKLFLPKQIHQTELNSISNYFENTPLPCMDNVTLAYPLYATQIEFTNSNIIDGSGNDVYSGHIPNKTEFTKQRFLSKFHPLRVLTDKLNSSNKLRKLTLTQAEWAGISGFSFEDIEHLFKQGNNVYEYWKQESKKRASWDYFDVRADIWGSFVESDRVIRKSRNLASIYDANLILPWCDVKVASYFSTLSENQLFDRKNFKNKLILRKILKNKIGLDSDKLGKMAFSFDFFSILMLMEHDVKNEIINCQLWNKDNINTIFLKLMNKNYTKKNQILLQRLYLISAWYNKNKYIKRDK